jgi:hypothetical protein
MTKDADRLDSIIDEALQDLTAGAPRDGFRGRVLARITETPKPAPVRIIELFGWRVRPWQAAAAGAATLVLAAAVLVAPGLWQARENALASKGRVAQGGTPTAVGGGLGPASPQVPQVVTQVASEDRQQPAARFARRPGAAVSAAAGSTGETPSRIPPVFIAPLAAPDEITIKPIDVTPLSIPDITIQEIQIPPIEGGKPKQ